MKRLSIVLLCFMVVSCSTTTPVLKNTGVVYLTDNKEAVVTNELWEQYKLILKDYRHFVAVVSGITDDYENHVMYDKDIVILDKLLTRAIVELLDLRDNISRDYPLELNELKSDQQVDTSSTIVLP